MLASMSQLNIRLSSSLDERLSKSARLTGVNKTEYVRKLIERDSEYVTGDEVTARVKCFIGKLTPAQRARAAKAVSAASKRAKARKKMLAA